MNKNIPNYLTILRLFLVIPFITLFSLPLFFGNHTFPKFHSESWQLYCILISGIIFLLAMFTDYLDGYLARKYNVVSTFGKFFDPIADKFIINSAMIIFAIYSVVPVWIVIPIIIRDTLVDGGRMMAAKDKIIISASSLGKLKTSILTFALGAIFFIAPINSLDANIYNNGWEIWLINIPMIICLMLSLISGYKYIIKVKIKF